MTCVIPTFSTKTGGSSPRGIAGREESKNDPQIYTTSTGRAMRVSRLSRLLINPSTVNISLYFGASVGKSRIQIGLAIAVNGVLL